MASEEQKVDELHPTQKITEISEGNAVQIKMQ